MTEAPPAAHTMRQEEQCHARIYHAIHRRERPARGRGPATRRRAGTRRLTVLPYRLSAALALMAGAAAAIGVLVPGVFHESGAGLGNTRGTALAMLIVALPVLLVAMLVAARGSLRARLVWLGALAYLLYNAVIFAFDIAFNRLFLLYVASLSLATWSLVALLMQVGAEEISARVAPALPARPIAVYLLATAALWGANWLGQVIPALVGDTAPTGLAATRMPTNLLHVLDLGFTLPLCALAGIWLWRRLPWGYVLSGIFLVMLTIEAASIAIDQLFGHLSDPTQPLITVPVFGALALVGLIPTVILLRHLGQDAQWGRNVDCHAFVATRGSGHGRAHTRWGSQHQGHGHQCDSTVHEAAASNRDLTLPLHGFVRNRPRPWTVCSVLVGSPPRSLRQGTPPSKRSTRYRNGRDDVREGERPMAAIYRGTPRDIWHAFATHLPGLTRR